MNCYISEYNNKYYCKDNFIKGSQYSPGHYNGQFILKTKIECGKFHKNIVHREDGPAVIAFNGFEMWYYNGEKIDCKDNEEFLKIMSMKAFL